MCLQLQVSSTDLYCPFKIIFNGVIALEKEWQVQHTCKNDSQIYNVPSIVRRADIY